ncbi:aminotransferase class IV [Porphyromonas circumdentaria]|uniref:aminotransferase class IV n=1 Tax=Porphyromonas circumdentaria TaxID=29524 RepID=UPI0026DC9EB7|nr:aminotransferase class IV [Porphyromonas circumdentaria]MDO4722402.1 aminotransferase class IV [Porphyromonas circumdentaria]
MEQLFIESIALRDGVVQLKDLHQERIDRTLRDHALPALQLPDLEVLCPIDCRQGLTKCRIIYGDKIEHISFEKYKQRALKHIALAALPSDYSYRYKSTNRSVLERLRRESGADEVILFNSKGHLTDSSYTNLIFLQEGSCYTPSTPLLEGVQRHYLLEKNRIEEREITLQGLNEYDYIGLINAMMPLEEMPLFAVKDLLR